MKKKLLIPVLLLPAFVFAKDTYTIKGKVGAYNAPAKAYLQYVKEGQRTVDSAAVENGAFTFTGTIAAPT